MQKDFDKWNEYKKTIDNNGRIVNFHAREIWWASIGINVGSEQDSVSVGFRRPVIIIKKFTDKTFLGIPLTKNHREINYRMSCPLNGVNGDALILQMRSFDSRRLIGKINTLPTVDFNNILYYIMHMFTKSLKTPSEGVSEAEAKVCTEIKSSPYVSSIEKTRILSRFFGDRYFPRLAISTRI